MFRTSDVVVIGALAGIAYWLYKKVSGPGSAIDTAENTIASLFPGTSPTVVPQGVVLMPDGTFVPVASLTKVGPIGQGGPLQMTDGAGNTYIITAGQSAGSYVATPMAGLMGYRKYRGARRGR
jgi:hypothetical protein